MPADPNSPYSTYTHPPDDGPGSMRDPTGSPTRARLISRQASIARGSAVGFALDGYGPMGAGGGVGPPGRGSPGVGNSPKGSFTSAAASFLAALSSPGGSRAMPVLQTAHSFDGQLTPPSLAAGSPGSLLAMSHLNKSSRMGAGAGGHRLGQRRR
ncbi:MAG: hypothetical protein WDW38_007349 [Sanguina aurantia]